MLSQNETLKLKSADLEVATTAEIGRNALTDLRKLLQDLRASSDTRPLGEILQDGTILFCCISA